MSSRKHSKIPTRQPWLKWLTSRTTAYDAAIALFVGVGGYANCLRAFRAGDDLPGWLWFSTCVGGFFFTVIRVMVQYGEARSNESTHELDGCLYVLHNQLMMQQPEDIRLRLTFWIPVDAKKLQQITDYVGGDAPKTGNLWREHSVHAGIIGRAFRTKEYVVANRQGADPEAFIKELVTNWSYTEKDAQDIDANVQCWMAVPIQLDEEGQTSPAIQGVLFADATVPDFFDQHRLDLTFAACGGIATYVAKRYK